MFKKMTLLVSAVAMTVCIGCGDEKKDDGTKAKEASGADLPDDAEVCCEFGAAVGSSTKKRCVEAKGKIRTDLVFPKCKPKQ